MMGVKLQCLSIIIGFGILVGLPGVSYSEEKAVPDRLPVVKQEISAISLSGVVTDAQGEPLIGVNVLEKGTNNGTSTDFEGNYALGNVEEDATLVFSYVGYQKQEIQVEGKTTINVQMASDAQLLDELVVVGYGTVKKSDLTGAVESVDVESMGEQPNISLMEGLQGSVPGLNVGQVDQAGENPSISIRGQVSLSGAGNPLIVLDGTIFRGNIVDINPSDVERVDVLKDASATAIYGSQASNGVILITTTNSGETKNGKPIINFSSQYSFQQPHKELRAQGPVEFMQKIEHSDIEQSRTKESGYLERNPDWSETTNFKTNHEIEQFQANRPFDWYDYVTTDNPYTTNLNLSLANSTEFTNYFTSLGYTYQDGYLKDENYGRINARINISNKVTDWLQVDMNSFMALSNYGPQTYGLGDRYYEPFANPYDLEGNLVQRPYGNPINPLIQAMADRDDKRLNLNGNITGNVKLPVDGLSYQLRFGNNFKANKDNYFGAHGSNFQGEGYKIENDEYNWSLDNLLSFERTLGVHYLNATLLYGVESRNFSYTEARGSNFTKNVLGYNRLQAAEVDQQRVESGGWKESSLYNMARLLYKLNDRYLVTGTVRRDGFSGFSEENKFGLFPSLALGWIVSEENFFQNIVPDWFGWLKLRASYGATGNRTIGRYQTLAKVSGEPGYVGSDGTPYYTQWISGLESPALKWEKTTGVNLGLDFGFNDGRFSGSVNYYNNNTTDLLYDVDIPGIGRFNTFSDNLGEIHNHGIEFNISTVNIQGENIHWTTDLNFSSNRNKINTLLGFDIDGDGQEDDLISEGLFIGESLGAIYDYQIDGIWQLDDEIPDGYEFGSYKVVDLNGDNTWDASDKTIIGNSQPAFRMGLGSVLEYRNFTLRLFANAILGGNNRYLGRDNLYSFNIFNNETHFNLAFPDNLDYWTPENPDAIYQRPGIKGASGLAGDRYTSRSFLRIRDLSLSYNLGNLFQSKFNKLKVTLSGRNLLTLTKWPGWDPETGTRITTGGRPVMRSFSFGIDVGF